LSERVLTFRFDREIPERLDKFLVGQLQEFSRSRIQGLIADGFVDVNDHAARKAGQTLENESTVTVRIPPPVPTDLIAENIPLEILFENNDVLVVNKEAGMVVHPAAGHADGTLVTQCLDMTPRSKVLVAKNARVLSTAWIKRPLV